jgi:AcrR family transcriptional regulator
MARTYSGVKHDERRAARRASLLAAGLELLGTAGYQATSVRGVCAEAQLTSRYFYESFRDLDELLLAVFDELVAELAVALLAAVREARGGDARAHARAAIAAGVELVTDDPRKARVLFVEARGSEVLARRRFEALHGFAELVAQQGREFYGLTDQPDGLIDVTAFMLVGGLSETFMAWLDGTLKSTAAELIDDCADLFVATGEGAAALARARSARL